VEGSDAGNVMTLSRRGFLSGLASALAAPAIVRSTSLMQVRGIVMPPAPIFTAEMGVYEGVRIIDDGYVMVAHPSLFRALQAEANKFADLSVAQLATRSIGVPIIQVIEQKPMPLAPWQEGPWRRPSAT
jgi:hypothetical protein